jgi:hypothetical protein
MPPENVLCLQKSRTLKVAPLEFEIDAVDSVVSVIHRPKGMKPASPNAAANSLRPRSGR